MSQQGRAGLVVTTVMQLILTAKDVCRSSEQRSGWYPCAYMNKKVVRTPRKVAYTGPFRSDIP